MDLFKTSLWSSFSRRVVGFNIVTVRCATDLLRRLINHVNISALIHRHQQMTNRYVFTNAQMWSRLRLGGFLIVLDLCIQILLNRFIQLMTCTLSLDWNDDILLFSIFLDDLKKIIIAWWLKAVPRAHIFL